MNKGKLNKTEINRLARAWRDLNDLVGSMPAETKDTYEAATLDRLLAARHELGVLLLWQAPDSIPSPSLGS